MMCSTGCGELQGAVLDHLNSDPPRTAGLPARVPSLIRHAHRKTGITPTTRGRADVSLLVSDISLGPVYRFVPRCQRRNRWWRSKRGQDRSGYRYFVRASCAFRGRCLRASKRLLEVSYRLVSWRSEQPTLFRPDENIPRPFPIARPGTHGALTVQPVQ